MPLSYFAYGSNMNPRRVLERGIVFHQVVAARLRGYTLRFDKRSRQEAGAGHANIAYAPEAVVEGVLYILSGPGEIEKMDPFELTPINYSRDAVLVETTAGETAAWTYFANAAVRSDGLRPPRWYMAHLLEGREYLSDQYVTWLETIECGP